MNIHPLKDVATVKIFSLKGEDTLKMTGIALQNATTTLVNNKKGTHMKKDLHISIPKELLDWIKEFRFEQKINSINQTICQIIEEKKQATEKENKE